MAAFGQNDPNWTLDAQVGTLEVIQKSEEELQERRATKKRAALL